MNTADLAWAAAVLDLKGRVTVKNNRQRRTPQVVLYASVKDGRVARRLAALTGTEPEPHERQSEPFSRRGCKVHCLEPHVHVQENGYPWQMPATVRWSLTGAAAAVVLLNLKPYMATSGDYADVTALILENLVTSGQGYGMVRSSLERLRELGWAVPAEIEAKLAAAGAPPATVHTETRTGTPAATAPARPGSQAPPAVSSARTK